MQATARLARVLGDETRLRILEALCEGDVTVTDLVVRLGRPQPRVSTHLAALREAGLIDVAVEGRQRTYRTDKSTVGPILAALRALASGGPERPAPSPQAAREIARNSSIRQARTCYDHLAGVAGVHLLDELLGRGWLVAEDVGAARRLYRLTPEGAVAMATCSVDLPRVDRSRRLFAVGCLDWTERRSHLGGALGVAIFRALESSGAARREPASRVVLLREPLDSWLGERAPA